MCQQAKQCSGIETAVRTGSAYSISHGQASSPSEHPLSLVAGAASLLLGHVEALGKILHPDPRLNCAIRPGLLEKVHRIPLHRLLSEGLLEARAENHGHLVRVAEVGSTRSAPHLSRSSDSLKKEKVGWRQ